MRDQPGSQQDIYAANPDPRESVLERIEATELKSFLAPLDVEIIRARNNEGNMFSSTGREIWHDLAVALAVLLVVRIDLRDLGGPLAMSEF